jgi:hypothetical protein
MAQVLTRRVRMASALLIAIAVMTVVACSSNGTPNPSASASPSPTSTNTSPTPTGATPTPPPQNVVSVSTSPSPTMDPTYGLISGFGLLAALPTSTPASTPAPTEVVTVSANQTIAFVNFDGVGHTASVLIPDTGGACSSFPSSPCFPALFNNTNGVVGLPAGTAISTPQFSTGTIPAGGGRASFSLMYSTGATTGIFFFGDFFDYHSSPPLRGIIIVQ